MQREIFPKLAAIVALWLLPLAYSHAQYSSDVFNLKKASDLYDERGFEQGKAISVDGKLVVTTSNGNVSYSYPISDYQVNGHPVKVSLNYCGSVSFTAFKDYKVADRVTSNPYKGWARFHQNRPAWIVGVDGFAIDVISSSLSYHVDPASRVYVTANTTFDDKDLVYVVDGYDFSNRMKDFGAPASHTSGESFVDEINLLREDGSLLQLVHVRPDSTLHPDDREDLYTGYYCANEANNHGYAVVEFDTSMRPEPITRIMQEQHPADSLGRNWNNTADSMYQVSRCFAGGCRNLPFYPRVIHYFPGNGEELIFHERMAPFGMGAYRDLYPRSGGYYAGPTMFYLERISTNSGPILTFQRPRHYPTIWRGFDAGSEYGTDWYWVDTTRGRALITEFDGHRISFGYNSMIIEALGRTTTVRFDQVTRNGNAATNETMPFANNGMLTPAALDLATWSETNPALYKSFIGYVTEIIDPLGRSTTFDYESYTRTYRNYGFPFADPLNNIDVLCKNLRLKAVHEPTATYNLTYGGSTTELVQKGTYPWPYQTTNVAYQMVKKDKAGHTLTTDNYTYDWGGTGNALQSVLKTTTDGVTGNTMAGTYYYSYINLSNLDPSLVAPRHTEMTGSVEVAGDVSTETVNTFTNTHTKPGGGTIAAPYLILPATQTVTVNGIVKTHQTFSYVVDTLRRFPERDTIVSYTYPTYDTTFRSLSGGPTLVGLYGMEPVTKITRLHNPTNYSALLRVDTTHFLHFNLTDTIVTWAAKEWNKFASIQSYLYHHDVLHDDLTKKYTWEQLMYSPPIGQYNLDTLTEEIYSPPSYGLAASTATVDGSGAYLLGTIKKYRTAISEGYGRQFLGSLLADTAIGRGGTLKLPVGSYRYADLLSGFAMPNLLTQVINANGSISGMMYDPSFCFQNPLGGWDTCLAPRTFNVLATDNTIRQRTHAPSGFSYLYGKPMIKNGTVRFYDASGLLARRDLPTSFEYSYYGVTAASVDPNGWLSEYEYDRNGRLVTAWLPRDFPKDSSTDTLDYSASIDEDLFGQTSYDREIDTVVCRVNDGTLTKRIGTGPRTTSYNVDTLMAMQMVTPVDTPHCRCEWELGGARAQRKDGADHGQMLETCNDALIFERAAGTDGYVGHLKYYVDSASALHSAIRLDSAILQTYITGVIGQCVHLVISIPQFSYSETVILNCPSPIVVFGTKKENAATQSVTTGPYGYRLTVDLRSLIPSLMGMSVGSTLGIDFAVTTSGGGVIMASGSYSEDARPKLLLRGKFRRISTRADYTLAFEHDDRNLVSTEHVKVDDIRHTANSYDLARFPGENMRRSTTTHYLGADYRVLESDLNTVLDNGSTRVDVTTTAYSGAGQKLTLTDAAGDAVSTSYDPAGRPVTITNADGTHAKVAYYYGTPSSFGITGQEFYGFCMATVTTNESGIKMVKYTDALDRLRREVADSGGAGHLNLTTRYEYDILGRLESSTDPKGTVTRYWYDEFGRVKYKQHPDLGIISYAYDALGNTRFSQDEDQADGNRVTFNQYDDLNRMTITGEAPLGLATRMKKRDAGPMLMGVDTSFDRITDWLDGTVLHDGGVSEILTANATLWQTPTVSVPSFWTMLQLDSTACSFGADTLLDETTAPVGWFLRHPAQQYAPNTTEGGYDFENVANNPELVRMAVGYDTLPRVAGGVWGRFPTHAQWDALAPTGKVRNLLSREAAVAYREHGGEPFHYAVLSYDERGRLEALLRYTENLGFDAVYYTYNSMEQVTSVRVVDPIHQYTSWYGCDHNGRTDSVWTLLGSGFGVSYPRYLAAPTHPTLADIVYGYNVAGQVDSMQYPPVSVLVTYAYNHRKWLDSMTATKGGAPLFKQVLTFDPTGQVLGQRWQHGTSPQVTQGYGYDSVQRLVRWANGTDTTRWGYDQVGNRISELSKVPLGAVRSQTYLYGGPVTGGVNRLGQTITQDTTGAILGQEGYGYDANGAVTGVRKWNGAGVLTSQDSLVYSDRGLLRQYTHLVPSSSTQEWHYRYSAGAEREQKRLYFQQDGSHHVIPHNSWVYYALGGKKEQLAVYHGQEMDLAGCVPPKPGSVYFYPVEYLTYGNGSSVGLVTKPDVGNPLGVKEFHIDDHLGSTRVTFNAMTGSQSYDYDPWGGLLVVGAPSREGYIGKELDKESGTLNCGVRQKREWWFGSIDPLWEKYRAWSPYSYSQASPVTLRDVNGMELDFSRVIQTQGDHPYMQTIMKELSFITGLTLCLDDKGFLHYDPNAEVQGGSATARKWLIRMMTESGITTVGVCDRYQTSVLRKLSPDHINFNPDEQSSTETGANGVAMLTMGWGMTLFHEYLHTVNGGLYNDPTKGPYGAIGVTDEVPNQIRCELGEERWGQRMSYLGKQIGSFIYVPFTPKASSVLGQGQVPPDGGYVRISVPTKGMVHPDGGPCPQ